MQYALVYSGTRILYTELLNFLMDSVLIPSDPSEMEACKWMYLRAIFFSKNRGWTTEVCF